MRAKSLLKSWRRLIVCLVAALMLIPAPAMALTFTSAWQSAISTTGGPTPPTPIVSDSTNGGDDNLFVNMGNYQGSTQKGLSSITLDRNISVPSAGEAISIASAFATQLADAALHLSVRVLDGSGNQVAAPITFNGTVSGTTFSTISANQKNTQTYNGGNFVLEVKINYETTNKIGGWKNISVHHFEFLGL
jgi:hypothetical protein